MEKCLSVDEPFRDKRAKFLVKLDEGQDLITPNKKIQILPGGLCHEDIFFSLEIIVSHHFFMAKA